MLFLQENVKQHVALKCSNVLKNVAQILNAAVCVIEQVSFAMMYALVTLVFKTGSLILLNNHFRLSIWLQTMHKPNLQTPIGLDPVQHARYRQHSI